MGEAQQTLGCQAPGWHEGPATFREPSSNDLLRKLDAELCEVFSSRCQIVTDDGDILLDVENHGGDVRALIADMFHVLPLHLQGKKKKKKED